MKYYDYIIVGSGIAGLYTALLAKEQGSVLIITKGSIDDCNTRYAQGGIAAAIGKKDSAELHFRDTIAAGYGLCDEEAVNILVKEAPDRITDLINMGVPFDTVEGEIALAMEAAHSSPRILHAGGVILEGKGLLLVGNSGAGKSTSVSMLADHAEILSDDRVIVRRWPDGFKAHGSWSYGQVPIVSASSVPLQAILFLEQARENRLVPIDERMDAIKRLLSCLIRPLVTADWWDKELSLVHSIACAVPCYVLRFDRSGGMVELLKGL